MTPYHHPDGDRDPGGEPGVDLLAGCALDRLPVWLGVHLALAAITAAILARSGSLATLGAWFLSVALVLGWQAHLWWRLRQAGWRVGGRSAHALTLGAAALGAAWGLAAALLEPPAAPLGHVYLPFVLAGLVGGALPALGSLLRAYLAFVGAALTPFALHLASAGGALDLALAALVVAYMIGMAQLGRSTHAQAIAAARLERVNQDLATAVGAKSAQLAATFDHAHHGIAVFDPDLRLVTWNPRHQELHGYPPELYRPGTPLQAFVHHDLERAGSTVTAEDGDEAVPSARHRPPAPARFELRGAGERILEVERGPLPGGGFVSTSSDITERKRAETRMLYLAQHDSLTGLPNRLLFHDRLRHGLARCRRDRTDLAVMLLDLDNFKQVNDALGHRVGDRILEEVALRLRAGLRESDTVARIGGDEFALILPVLPQTEAAAVVARKILTRLEAPVEIEDRSVALRASLGLALFPHDGDGSEQLLQNADLAMYRAKAAGGGFRPFAAGIRREFDHRLSLERELQHAIERQQLSLQYQPLLDLKHQRISGVEALLRWRHPELGEIGPETLIRTAEGSGQIKRIGAWILEQACFAATTWPSDGVPLRVAVNVSGAQLRDPKLVELIRRILAETGWPAAQLELELTETGPIAEIAEVAPMVKDLRELGVSLAIDDFGAGHTGLGHLRQLPLDALKIDRSLVTGLAAEADAAIAGSLIELGHRLHLRVVAEGVETAAQLAILERLGCDEAQGHIVGLPASSAEMAARLGAATRAAG